MSGYDGEQSFSWWDVHWMAPVWQLLTALERLSSLHPLSVIARKRLDISFQDLARAFSLSLMALLVPGKASEAVREEAQLEVSRAWSSSRSGVRCSSAAVLICSLPTCMQLLLLYNCCTCQIFGPKIRSFVSSALSSTAVQQYDE